MRYKPEQAEKTRRHVVEVAAAEMRKHGPDGVGVAEVMSRAGLTHGGFYAHFKSKDDLIAAAIDRMFEDARARFREWTEGKPKEQALHDYINRYVSLVHRDGPKTGCPIPALSSDIHRQGKKCRAAYDSGVAGFVTRLTTLLPGDDDAKRRSLALSMVAEMTGAVAAARAVSDATLSDEILTTARRSLRARAGLAPSQHERPHP